MLIWAKRRYSYEGHKGDLETFAKIFEQRSNAPGMMMVEAKLDHTHHRDVYIAVPDRLMLTAFLAYKVIDESEVPREVNLLMGDADEFKERFGR